MTDIGPANFNGARPVIDPENAVLLMIDHQSGLFQTVKDMPMTTCVATRQLWRRWLRLPTSR